VRHVLVETEALLDVELHASGEAEAQLRAEPELPVMLCPRVGDRQAGTSQQASRRETNQDQAS
jgi:hypothetical protein